MAEANNYVVGKGRLMFERFADDQVDPTGAFRYFGNTPELSLSQAVETLDHYDSDAGLRYKDASVDLSNDQSGSFTTDNINPQNLALFFLGESAAETIGAQSDASETFTDLVLGNFYQVGMDTLTPQGLGGISDVKLYADSVGGASIAAADNWSYESATGLIYIFPDAVDIDTDDAIYVTYDVAATSRQVTIGAGQSILPYVKISPDGDYALKSDEWQVMGFTFEVLKNPNLARVYITDRA